MSFIVCKPMFDIFDSLLYNSICMLDSVSGMFFKCLHYPSLPWERVGVFVSRRIKT